MVSAAAPNAGFRRVWLPALLAAALGVAAYLNALHNPFVYDDIREVVENPSIGAAGDLGAIIRYYPTRPLTNLSYALDFARGGLDPFAYHATSIALHAVNVGLLFILIIRLLPISTPGSAEGPAFEPFAAFAAASLFAVHPMMTQAVGYVSARAEVLAATCVLSSLLAFDAFARDAKRLVWAFAGIAFFALALAAKETALAVPLILLVYDRLLANRSGSQQRNPLARIYVPLIAAAVIVGALRMTRYATVEQAGYGDVQWMNLLLEVHVFQRYLFLLLLPISQSLVPAFQMVTSIWDVRFLGAALIIGLVIDFGFRMRRRPIVPFGVVWFFIMLVPSALIVVVADRGEPMAEHRVYLASCGLFMAVAGLISVFLSGRPERMQVRRRGLVALLCILVPVLMTLTIARNRVWSDPVGLMEDAVLKAPESWLAQYGLAQTYRSEGNCESAAPAYRRAITLRPGNADGYLGLAQCALDAHDVNAARQTLRSGIAAAPRDNRARLALATVENNVFGDRAEAMRLCREALAIAPGDSEAQECVTRFEK